MIGTEQVASTATTEIARLSSIMLSRVEVRSQLQALGIDPAQAKDRVQAMSDQANRDARQQARVTAGGASDGGAVFSSSSSRGGVVVHV